MVLRVSRLLRAALLCGIGALWTTGGAQAQAPADMALSEPSSQDAVALEVGKRFQSRFGGIEVTQVRPTSFGGLYEVQIGGDLLYTNANVDYVLQGALIDAKTHRDLTAERLAKLSEVPFDSLPLHLAVKQVKGNGERKLAVFEDPNCGYCKMLHKTLAQIDNTTVYTLLFPILSPDSETKARNIWCAKDQAATWRDWMVNGKTPPEAKCDTPIEEILTLGRKMLVQGTPAIIFSDGSRVNGALPLEALNKKLASLKSA